MTWSRPLLPVVASGLLARVGFIFKIRGSLSVVSGLLIVKKELKKSLPAKVTRERKLGLKSSNKMARFHLPF
ncbi:MAG: hypothetical protein HY892_18535 [Deltaproteobacteria bacterium]|nr:hypothetical protein [Deltaproteobacteria bacterium]